MLISVTFSKPVNNILDFFDKKYKKIKIKYSSLSSNASYFAEFFTDTQVFHKNFTTQELEDFINSNLGITFKSCVKRFTDKEITYLTNSKNKTTTIEKPLNQTQKSSCINLASNANNRKKNYIIPEGKPVPFLVLLGVMTEEGKVINSKYDKFKQINRFLEYIDDILPTVLEQKKDTSPLQIADFGCGKSYLTFAVQYFLCSIKKIDCNIIGLDLKEDVINYCNKITKELNLSNLIFKVGDISKYSKNSSPDIVITLHACDTATDFALQYAIKNNALAILSVPCCQHEVNSLIDKNKKQKLIKN